MKCEICGKDILKDSQCINYKYYHNDCIINLIKENQELKGRIEYLERSCERKDESNIELYSENVDLASAIDEIKKYIDEYLLNERLVTYRDFRNGLLKIIEKVEK